MITEIFSISEHYIPCKLLPFLPLPILEFDPVNKFSVAEINSDKILSVIIPVLYGDTSITDTILFLCLFLKFKMSVIMPINEIEYLD